MPRGIPNKSKSTDETPCKLSITLRPDDYDALAQLAVEQYRTVELQAAWLLVKVLSEAGRTPPTNTATHVARILDRANSRAHTEIKDS